MESWLAELAAAQASSTIGARQYGACNDAFEAVRQAVLSCNAKIEELQAANRDVEININVEAIDVERSRFRKDEIGRSVSAGDADWRNAVDGFKTLEAKETALQTEINEAKLRENELISDVAQLKRDNEDMVTPALQGIADAVVDAKAEFARCTSALEAAGEQSKDLKGKIEEVRAAGRASHDVVQRLKQELARAQGEPPRLQRQLEIVHDALAVAGKDKDVLLEALAQREKELASQGASLSEVQSMRHVLDKKLGGHRHEVEAAEHDVMELEKAVRAEKQQRKELLEKRVELIADEEAARNSSRLSSAAADSAGQSYERAKRELKRVMDRLNDTSAATAPLVQTLKEKEKEVQTCEAEAARFGREETIVRKSMDVVVAKYLKEEAVEKKHREVLAELAAECTALDDEKEQWAQEEAIAEKQLSSLRAAQEMKSRELAKTVVARKATIESSRAKELALLDLTKQLADMQARLKTSTGLYEAVKAERNGLSTAIQRAKQAIAEMQERLKILANEADILGGEAESKDKALGKEKQSHVATSIQRDVLRAEVNKAVNLYRSKQNSVEGTILSIDKLSATIAGLERGMLGMKRDYETAVEMRNYTGIQLIDRNDELCILYEKANIQEKTLERGESELRMVGDEVRGLQLTLQELQRLLYVAKNKAPHAPMWAEKVLQLQHEVAQAKRETELLSTRMESPSDGTTWVALGGSDPSTEELASREMEITAQLDAARSILLQRDMSLEEVVALIARLKAEVAGVTPGQIDSQAALARTVNELQSKLRESTRKLMALVSELSLYQSTALRLQAQVSSSTEALAQARDVAARGLPPTTAAESKWSSMERTRQLATARPDDGEAVIAGPEARPTAYLVTGTETPQPYGQFAPFKPSEPGASARFFRPVAV